MPALTPAMRQGVAVSVATGLYAISFGALAVAAGLEVWQASALSALMFTGGSQFAFVGVLAGGGAPATAFWGATVLGIRNAIYGMQIKALAKPRPAMIPIMAQFTIDESMAVSSAQEDRAEQRRGFWWAGVGVWVLWNLFTLVGAIAGDALGDPKQFGLDGAAVAAFLGLMWPRLKSRDAVAMAVASAVVTIILIPLVPAGIPILLAGLIALASLRGGK